VTTEYVPGAEDIAIQIYPRLDGYVQLAIYLAANNERLYGVVVTPEIARTMAEKLTMSSWICEGSGQ